MKDGILVLEGSKEGLCRGCGAKLRWYLTFPKKARMPFDGEPRLLEDTGCKDGGVRLLRVATDRVHWATCPKAFKFRGRRNEIGE